MKELTGSIEKTSFIRVGAEEVQGTGDIIARDTSGGLSA